MHMSVYTSVVVHTLVQLGFVRKRDCGKNVNDVRGLAYVFALFDFFLTSLIVLHPLFILFVC